MTEFLVVSALWLAFLVWASRRGVAHLLAKHVAVTLPLVGGVCGALLEALPTSAISPGFTLRTVIAVLAGVFAGRLFGKVAILWAAGHARRAAGDPKARPPRLVHPLIAVGLFVAGVPALWHVVTSNHEFIEEKTTPRDETTGIVHGSEEVRVERGAPDAVLLIHGLYGSPADFGDLPKALESQGFDVFAPLLPGHGRVPDALDSVWAEDYRKAVRAAFDALAATHRRVSVVGGSMDAALALTLASERKPAALVLVGPYLGRLATPSWCPVSFDSLVGPLSRVARRVLASEDTRGRRYCTLSLHALRQCRDLARNVDDEATRAACPALVIVGGQDEIVETKGTLDWAKSHLPGATTALFPSSRHDLFHDVERAAAVEAAAKFLAENAKR